MSANTVKNGRNEAKMIVLRVLIAVGLAIDAIVHLQTASTYQMAFPGGIGGGTVFRLQAGAAILVGLWVLLRGSRASYLAAAVVAFSAFAAVVLYRYIQIPAIGPLPSMYEPVWFFEKTLSAVAEGAAAVLAVIGFILLTRARNSYGNASGSEQS